jgi:hypothetical protein
MTIANISSNIKQSFNQNPINHGQDQNYSDKKLSGGRVAAVAGCILGGAGVLGGITVGTSSSVLAGIAVGSGTVVGGAVYLALAISQRMVVFVKDGENVLPCCGNPCHAKNDQDIEKEAGNLLV